MKTYARVLNSVVMELFATTASIGSLFHPSVRWVDVTGNTNVQVGWLALPDGTFAAPVAAPSVLPPATLASVQAQLTVLQAQVNALAASGAH